MAEYIVVFVTASTKKEAQKIANTLLKKKLCACVNMIDGIKSLFHWEGKIDSAEETLLVIKTKKSAYTKLEKAVKSVHSYSTPEIIALPIISGSRDYLNWIQKTVK
jgi:periplasmic divalent cation tolerance protein